MYVVYIDDSIATVTSSPVEADLYKDQLERQGHKNVHIDSDK